MEAEQYEGEIRSAQADAARIRNEIREMRKAKAERGGIRAAGWQLRQIEDWLWEMRFLAWDLIDQGADREQTERILAKRAEVPF